MNDSARATPPAAYELKRLVAARRQAFWKSDIIADLPSASIYVFPDQQAFDGDEVDQLARRLSSDPPRLPHSDVIFEVVDSQQGGRSSVVYARERDGAIDAVLFARPGQRAQWTDAICHAHCRPDGSGWCELNPHVRQISRENVLEVVQGMTVRATALIMAEACTEEVPLSRLRRTMLAKHGVSGWTYRIASLDPLTLRRLSETQGGTHAPPRWHIRRGHWRQLIDGRRVFVRECEVGDIARGGVIKDYRVSASDEA